jgi:inosose dehydratase
VGGGDPIQGLLDWSDRINHLHIKDCRTDVVQVIVHELEPSDEIWRRHAFCRLGDGDLGVDAFLAGVQELGFTGWMVVEQDGILDEVWPLDRAFEDQAANRAYLRARGL